jgi:hypothetical protein
MTIEKKKTINESGAHCSVILQEDNLKSTEAHVFYVT